MTRHGTSPGSVARIPGRLAAPAARRGATCRYRHRSMLTMLSLGPPPIIFHVAPVSPPTTTTLDVLRAEHLHGLVGRRPSARWRTARCRRPPAGARASASTGCPSTRAPGSSAFSAHQSMSFCFVSKPHSTKPRATSGSSATIGPMNGSHAAASGGTSPATSRAGRRRRSCTSRRGTGSRCCRSGSKPCWTWNGSHGLAPRSRRTSAL